MANDRIRRVVVLLRWSARVWGTLMLLLWGAFFVEHLSWFVDPGGPPPASVWLLQLLHLALLVGLAMAWRWEVLGGTVALASAVGFFSQAAGPRFLPLTAVTAAPALLWIACGWLSRRLESKR